MEAIGRTKEQSREDDEIKIEKCMSAIMSPVDALDVFVCNVSLSEILPTLFVAEYPNSRAPLNDDTGRHCKAWLKSVSHIRRV